MNKTKDISHSIKPKVKYKIHNWSQYNKSLVQRGSIGLWLTDDITDWWYDSGRNTYSDRSIECILILKVVYKLPLRQIVGFMRSIFESSGTTLVVPDYTTICRRTQELDIQLKKTNKVITDIIVDSTGVRVYGEGEWKVRKHGWGYRRTWKKIHLGIDSNGEIRAVTITHSDSHDMVAVKQLLDQEKSVVTDFYGDGAYDSNNLYRELEKRGVIGYHIPPQYNAKITQKSHFVRNGHIEDIQKSSREDWKKTNGYHTRSLVETTMFRYKTIFGDRLSARTQSSQKAEIITKCNILNTFHYLCAIDSRVVSP
jgi:IS5 family transposase